jgi:hypothetical protein
MKITWNELTIPFERNDDLFEDWRWLVGTSAQPILITSLGDAFFQENSEKVFWLDVGRSKYSQVAESQKDFEQKMKINENITEWFMPNLVAALITQLGTLKPHSCYSFLRLPVLGGDYLEKNFAQADIEVHFSLTGQICRQIKDLPEGSKIKLKLEK